MSRFVSVEFDAICVTVHKISITAKETISPLYCVDIPKGVGKPKPWEGEPSNAWYNEAESDEMFINTYHLFLHADFAEENAIGHNQEMSKMFPRQSDQEGAEDGDNDDTNESDYDGTNNDQHEETDDWMLLCRLNQHYEQSCVLLLENGTD